MRRLPWSLDYKLSSHCLECQLSMLIALISFVCIPRIWSLFQETLSPPKSCQVLLQQTVGSSPGQTSGRAHSRVLCVSMFAHYPLASFGLWVARVSACFALSCHTLRGPIPKNTGRQVYRMIGSRVHWNRMENHTDSISSLFSYSNEHDTPWHWILVRVCTFRISEDSLKPSLFRYENFPWLWLRKSRRFYYLTMK